jgi:secondary thiamine-phosphate synthase enzyme
MRLNGLAPFSSCTAIVEFSQSPMPIHQTTLTVTAQRQGTHEITDAIAKEVKRSGFSVGIVTVFCQHTSCSLVMMENADRTARLDLESWLNRLVREDDPHFKHTAEGADDMPSHIKMALTRTTETLPFSNGKLLLGTWQGLFLWEHRRATHNRQLVVTVVGE